MPSKNYLDYFRDFIKDKSLTNESVFGKEEVFDWFKKNLPDAKRANLEEQLVKKTTNNPNRARHKPSQTDDLFFAEDREFTTFRLYQQNHPTPLYKTGDNPLDTLKAIVKDIENNGVQKAEEDKFAYEKDLQNYLAKHPDKIEPGLRLYEDDGITGFEYSAGGGRRIDLLCLDRDKNLVVVELKVSRGHEQVTGQLLRYMGWIKENLADSQQNVRGVIVARNISEDLKLSASMCPAIDLFEYEMSVKLKKIEC